MNYNNWTVSEDGQSAQHESGWDIRIQGHPKNPHEVSPGSLPSGITGLDQVRLLRHGLEAIAKACKGGAEGGYSTASKPSAKNHTVRQAAKVMTLDPNRKRKPILSLKRKASAE